MRDFLKFFCLTFLPVLLAPLSKPSPELEEFYRNPDFVPYRWYQYDYHGESWGDDPYMATPPDTGLPLSDIKPESTFPAQSNCSF